MSATGTNPNAIGAYNHSPHEQARVRSGAEFNCTQAHRARKIDSANSAHGLIIPEGDLGDDEPGFPDPRPPAVCARARRHRQNLRRPPLCPLRALCRPHPIRRSPASFQYTPPSHLRRYGHPAQAARAIFCHSTHPYAAPMYEAHRLTPQSFRAETYTPRGACIRKRIRLGLCLLP